MPILPCCCPCKNLQHVGACCFCTDNIKLACDIVCPTITDLNGHTVSCDLELVAVQSSSSWPQLVVNRNRPGLTDCGTISGTITLDGVATDPNDWIMFFGLDYNYSAVGVTDVALTLYGYPPTGYDPGVYFPVGWGDYGTCDCAGIPEQALATSYAYSTDTEPYTAMYGTISGVLLDNPICWDGSANCIPGTQMADGSCATGAMPAKSSKALAPKAKPCGTCSRAKKP